MKKYGNILINRRMAAIVCMLVVSLLTLMPSQAVRADAQTYAKVISIDFTKDSGDNKYDGDYSASMTCSVHSDYPVYSFAFNDATYGFITRAGSTAVDFYNKSKFKVTRGGEVVMQMDNAFGASSKDYDSITYIYCYGSTYDLDNDSNKYVSSNCDYVVTADGYDKCWAELLKVLSGGSSDYVTNGNAFVARTYDSSLGFLAGVELQQIHDKSQEHKGSPYGTGLMETIIYNDQTTTGIDLKNGGYKVEIAWADAFLNAKKTAYYSEDKKKTSICKFDAKLNCKSADVLKRYYYNVLDANKKCKDNATEGFEPSMFTIITKHLSSQPTYWYRIITQDGRYSGWVKLGVTGGGVDDISFPQDTYDNEDNKVDADHGGYHKDNSKEAIGSGDSKDEAIEDSVADSQRKDDNNLINNGSSKDLWDSLKEFVKGVESVPVMIADLFSFLPSWCLGLVASGFALMIVLMIINCIKS